MRYLIGGSSSAAGRVVFLCIVATAIAVAVLGYTSSEASTSSCSGVHIRPGNDLDAIVNRDPYNKATTFCIHAAPSGTTYTINNTVVLKPGDKLIGQRGRVLRRGPASYGVPLVKIRNGASLPKLIQVTGPRVRLAWLDVAGAAVDFENGAPLNSSGHAIAAWGGNATTRMAYLAVHHNPNTGIVNMTGKLMHSNLYENGYYRPFQGETAAAVKGVHEYEAAYNYVHDNAANGLWCDHRCSDAGPAMVYGFWAHHNLIVNNRRWGVRYEYSPIVASGVHAARPMAFIVANEIHGNGYKGSYGGISMHDAQNGTFRNNVFGARTIAGVRYAPNAGRSAIVFSDSGRRDRTDLWNGAAAYNSLRGEAIEGCRRPDRVVTCKGNR